MTLEAGGDLHRHYRETDYDETGATTEDLEGVVDYARSIEGVEIGVLIEDRGGRIKGSLRGKGMKYRLDKLLPSLTAEDMLRLLD